MNTHADIATPTALKLETLQHQIFECPKMETKLRKERKRYLDLEAQSFNDALWTHPKVMTQILRRAKEKGCHI